MEACKSDLDFLVDSVHDEFVEYEKSKGKLTAAPPPESLVELCRTLYHQLDALKDEREKWWSAPESRAKRTRFELNGDQKNLSELHKINNTTSASFESISARFGAFVKWGLGMNGGVFELLNAHKVSKGN